MDIKISIPTPHTDLRQYIDTEKVIIDYQIPPHIKKISLNEVLEFVLRQIEKECESDKK